MSDALPDSEVLSLPPPKRPPAPVRHQLGGPVYVAPDQSESGLEQHERTCSVCGAIKITILDRAADIYRRAWRASADVAQVETFVAPACERRG